jgi:hypothetical protein
MSYETDSPPFQPGETYYGSRTPSSSDTGCQDWEGRIWDFPDEKLGDSGVKTLRTNKRVRRMIVRNKGTVALPPKRLAKMRVSGIDLVGQVAEMGRTTGDLCFPVDEFLPSTGIPVNDWGYIVVGGPALVKLPAAAADISVGAILTADTTANSTGTDAGRVAAAAWSISSQATDLTNIALSIVNMLGRAMSSATSGSDDGDLLAHIGNKW